MKTGIFAKTGISPNIIIYHDARVTRDADPNRLEMLTDANSEVQRIHRVETVPANLPLGPELARLADVTRYRELQHDDLSLKFCWDLADKTGSEFVLRTSNQLLFHRHTVGGFLVEQLVLAEAKRFKVAPITLTGLVILLTTKLCYV